MSYMAEGWELGHSLFCLRFLQAPTAVSLPMVLSENFSLL
jgi:hypothetical protein